MRPIEFQDSFSKTPNVEKLQSRDIHRPADDNALAAQKQAIIDEEKKSQIQSSEETRDKLVDKDKHNREKAKDNRPKNGEQKKENDTLERKRQRRGGFFLIDIDA